MGTDTLHTPAVTSREDVFTELKVGVVMLAIVAVFVWFAITIIVGLVVRSDWRLETTPAHAAMPSTPRVEASPMSWLGEGEDRYGVDPGGSERLRIARHCDGEWSFTYPTAAVLPPEGTLVVVRIETPSDAPVEAIGRMASNGVTVVVPPLQALDAALFRNTETVITATTSVGQRISLTNAVLRSRPPRMWPAAWSNPVSGTQDSRVFDPLSALADACATAPKSSP